MTPEFIMPDGTDVPETGGRPDDARVDLPDASTSEGAPIGRGDEAVDEAGETRPIETRESDAVPESLSDAFTEEEINESKNKFRTDYEGIVNERDLEVLLDKTKSPEEVKRAAENADLPYDAIKDILHKTGHGQETQDLIDTHKHGFREPENPQSDDEQELADQIRNTKAATDLMQNIDPESETAEEDIHKAEEEVQKTLSMVGRIKDKFKDKLFNPGTGLFREEDRAKRLVAKPLVTVLLTMAILYAMILHIATRWATKRVGRG